MPHFIPDTEVLRSVAIAPHVVQTLFLIALAHVQSNGIDAIIDFSNAQLDEKELSEGLFQSTTMQLLQSHDGNDYRLHPRLYSAGHLAVGLPVAGRSTNRLAEMNSLVGLWMNRVGVGKIGYVRKIIKELLDVSGTPARIRSAIEYIGDHKSELEIKSPRFLQIFIESDGNFGAQVTKDDGFLVSPMKVVK